VELVTGPMLDAAAPRARWINVLGDAGAFDVEQARTILSAGIRQGLGARMYLGQLGESGGVRLAVELGATAVDHCMFPSAAVDALANSDTVAAPCRASNSPRNSPTPMRDDFQMPVSPWLWPTTAILDQPSPDGCPSASRCRYARWG